MKNEIITSDFISYKQKKRFIVVSLYGYVSDYGIMDVDEIEMMKNKMLEANEYTPGEPIRIFARINNLEDLVVLCWQQEVIK